MSPAKRLATEVLARMHLPGARWDGLESLCRMVIGRKKTPKKLWLPGKSRATRREEIDTEDAKVRAERQADVWSNHAHEATRRAEAAEKRAEEARAESESAELARHAATQRVQALELAISASQQREAGLAAALLGVRDFDDGDGKPCWCCDGRSEAEGGYHSPPCLAARAALAAHQGAGATCDYCQAPAHPDHCDSWVCGKCGAPNPNPSAALSPAPAAPGSPAPILEEENRCRKGHEDCNGIECGGLMPGHWVSDENCDECGGQGVVTRAFAVPHDQPCPKCSPAPDGTKEDAP